MSVFRCVTVMLVFFAPLGVALSYLVPCFQQCSWENIFKFWFMNALKLIMFSKLQGFYNPICNLGDSHWVDLDLSWSDTYPPSTICVISWRFGFRGNRITGWNSTIVLWKINFSLSKQQKEGCHMKKSFSKSTEESYKRKNFRTNTQWEILYQKRMAWIKTNK